MTIFPPPIYLKERNWFKLLTNVQGSIIPSVFPRVMYCSLFALIVTIVYKLGFTAIALDILTSEVTSIVLALLLVFRTNAAYSRFWEGRKLWGCMANTIYNLARSVYVVIEEKTPSDKQEKTQAINLLVAFAISVKLHLRWQKVDSQLAKLLTSQQYQRLENSDRPPLIISLWLTEYLQKQYKSDKVSSYQITEMFKHLDSLVDAMGGCDRILKTSIPLAYSIHLRQFIFIYCLTLPFQLVATSGWLTPCITALVSYALIGIKEISMEIENPFGHDANDLNLDEICQTIQRNINDLISAESTTELTGDMPLNQIC